VGDINFIAIVINAGHIAMLFINVLELISVDFH